LTGKDFSLTRGWRRLSFPAKMYKLDLPVDYKEAAAIERRRQMEAERKTRIFNAKTRQIGVSNVTCQVLRYKSRSKTRA
jgi:hypothetical protein